MTHTQQRGVKHCGLACAAAIAGVSLTEAFRCLYPRQQAALARGMTAYTLSCLLADLTGRKWRHYRGENRPLWQLWPLWQDAPLAAAIRPAPDRGHWVVCYRDLVSDPAYAEVIDVRRYPFIEAPVTHVVARPDRLRT